MAKSRRVPEAQRCLRRFLEDAAWALEAKAISAFDHRTAAAVVGAVGLFDNVEDRVALAQLEKRIHLHPAPSPDAQKRRRNRISRALVSLSEQTLMRLDEVEGGYRAGVGKTGVGKSARVSFYEYLGDTEEVYRNRCTLRWFREAESVYQGQYTDNRDRCTDTGPGGVPKPVERCTDTGGPTEILPSLESEHDHARLGHAPDSRPDDGPGFEPDFSALRQRLSKVGRGAL